MTDKRQPVAVQRRRRAITTLLSGAVLAGRAIRGPAVAVAVADPEAVYVPETGHHLQAGFLDYWRRHQGPTHLGFPLTEERWDAGVGGMVQHFGRARLEWRDTGPGDVRETPQSLDATRARALGLDVTPVPRRPGVPDWSAALAPPPPSVTFTPDPVRPGRAFLIAADVADVAAPLTVAGVLNRSGPPLPTGQIAPAPPVAPSAPVALRLFPTGAAHYLAIATVSMEEAPGLWAITAGTRNGLGLESPPQEVVFQVVDGAFPLQRLAFASELIPLLAPEVGDQERLTIAAVTAQSAPRPLWQGRFLQPVTGSLVTTHGSRRTYLDPAGRAITTSQHAGVDLATAAGTPIAAPAGGVVAFTGTWSIRGNVIVVDHGAGVHSIYGHTSFIAVEPGQPVERGQTLGRVGSTGLSTGPHLHWEVRVLGQAVDPLEWTQRPELGLS
jgi:hypothetical protein